MGRPPNPARKPELLTQILHHVGETSLSQVTFRRLAAALGVSTYVLVYHFGTRRELIDAILDETTRIRRLALDGHDIGTLNREEMLEWIRDAFARSLEPEHTASLRLQFEAAALESVDPDIGSRVARAYCDWVTVFTAWARVRGVDDEHTSDLAALIANSLFGAHFGFLITGNRDSSIRQFDLSLSAITRLMDELVAQSSGD